MPHAELVDWMDFASLEPFGSHVDDLRAGSMAAVVANVHRDSKDRPEPYSPLDFVPWNSLHLQEPEIETVGADLNAEELSALIDAQLFGRAPNRRP